MIFITKGFGFRLLVLVRSALSQGKQQPRRAEGSYKTNLGFPNTQQNLRLIAHMPNWNTDISVLKLILLQKSNIQIYEQKLNFVFVP